MTWAQVASPEPFYKDAVLDDIVTMCLAADLQYVHGESIILSVTLCNNLMPVFDMVSKKRL